MGRRRGELAKGYGRDKGFYLDNGRKRWGRIERERVKKPFESA
jgi:hypothetical protein